MFLLDWRQQGGIHGDVAAGQPDVVSHPAGIFTDPTSERVLGDAMALGCERS